MRQRNQDDFTEFVAARGPALQRTAYLLVGERGLARDLVQEALTKTWVAWPKLRDAHAGEAWTRKALHTTAIDWYRKKHWNAERPATEVPDRVVAADQELVGTREWLWQAVRALPARQRATLVCRFYDDLTEVQTAEVLGCAVGTVKSQTSAALRTLREQLSDEDCDPTLIDALMEAAR